MHNYGSKAAVIDRGTLSKASGLRLAEAVNVSNSTASIRFGDTCPRSQRHA
ncbi:hypothetical protein ABZ307_22255 [Streptomyces griseorubiginosus]|uniref:hypothetical protein n=1 Tax=Streptomyces griseorubiginosus TaxID=67304 RepID=UPI0033B94DE1